MRAAPPSESLELNRPRLAWTLAALVALGAALRFTGLAHDSLWYDELASWRLIQQGDLVAALRADRHPPLFYALARTWRGLFGDGEAALRALPALFSTLGLVCAARAAWRVASARAALCATALLALSPFSIGQAQDFRMYALAECGCALALCALLELPHARRAWLPCAALGLGVALAFGSHYYGLFALPIALGALALEARGPGVARSAPRARAAAGAAVAGALLWLPWLALVLREQMRTPWGVLDQASPREALLTPIKLVFGPSDALPPSCAWLRWLFGAAAALALARAALAAAGVCASATERRSARLALWALCVPIGGALAAIPFVGAHFTTRYLIAAAPGACLAIGCGAALLGETLRARAPRALAASAALLPLALLVLPCATLLAAQRRAPHKEGFRAAFADLRASWQPGDALCVLSGTPAGFNEAPALYYLRDAPELLAHLIEQDAPLGSADLARFGRRLHVVLRDAVYARARLADLESKGRWVAIDPLRARVQHRILRPAGS